MTRRFSLAIFLFLLFVARIPAQVPPEQASQAPAQYSAMYTDSRADLQHFVEDPLSAIKASDNAKVDSLWQSSILSDHVKVLVLPLAQAAVSRPDSWAKAIQLSLKGEVHAYRVETVSAGSTSSIMLGYFFYVSGGFREVDELVFGSLSAAKRSRLLP